VRAVPSAGRRAGWPESGLVRRLQGQFLVNGARRNPLTISDGFATC